MSAICRGVTAAMSVAANLRYHTALLGQGRADLMGILSRLGLARHSETPVRHLSAGQRKRLGLARLLSAPRPLWLLDEPSASLDEEGATLLSAITAEHRGQGGITVVATHDRTILPPTAELTLRPDAP